MGERRLPTEVERYVSSRSVAVLWEFGEKKIIKMARDGDFTTRTSSGEVIAEPMEVAGEIRIPVSGLNRYAKEHPYIYNDAIAARNKDELIRKLSGRKKE
jgi:hypothetical protein